MILKKEITALAASVKEFKKTLAEEKESAPPASEDSYKKRQNSLTDPNWKFDNPKNHCWLNKDSVQLYACKKCDARHGKKMM